MTEDEIKAFLAMGGTEDEISELLREKDRQEGLMDKAGEYSPTVDAGAYVVPNFAAPIREALAGYKGRKELKKIEGGVANKRAGLNENARDYFRAASGLGLGGVDLHATPQVKAPTPMPITPAPQVPPPPPAGPVGPPAGAAPPPAPPQAPPPGPPAPGPKPPPAGMVMGPNGLPTHPEFNDVPGLPGQGDDKQAMDEIQALLRAMNAAGVG